MIRKIHDHLAASKATRTLMFFVVLPTAIILAAGCRRPEARPNLQEQLTALRSDSVDDRYLGLANLQTLGPDAAEAVPDLRTLLKATKDDDLAAEIAKTLGIIGPAAAAALPELTALLGRKAMWPRYAAAEALGRLGPAALPSYPKLVALTKDPDRQIASVARESVRRLQHTTKRK